MALRKVVSAFPLFALLLVGTHMFGQVRPRVMQKVVESDTIALPGNVHPLLRRATNSTPLAFNTRLENLVLVLSAGQDQQAALAALIEEQNTPGSANYHKFLTPKQFQSRFGIAAADLAAVRSWLESNGLTVDDVPAGGRSIVFSGTAAQVDNAFHTEMRQYTIDGEEHVANASDPLIPRALAGVVNGVLRLHDFQHQPFLVQPHISQPATTVLPAFAPSGLRYLTPGDYATIYDIQPLWNAGIDGTGQSIAVLARSNIYLSDVQSFRSMFNLKSNDPKLIITNKDPGQVRTDNIETTLDTEWAGAVAPGATIKVIISSSSASRDGIDLSALYAVSNNIAQIITVSYGSCEAALGSAGMAYYHSLWQQAAAQGQTVLVASGDSGAAGCDLSSSNTAIKGKGVNGLCSSPSSTCVGGTQFVEGANPAQYWLPTGPGSVVGSAISYIPEAAWNESAGNSGGSALWSSGGGASTVYAKPAWQTGNGVPNDKMRDVPDVSLTAALHDGYTVVQGGMLGYIFPVSGTSASTPSFAGIMALVNHRNNSSQGNINPTLYNLFNNQGKSGAAIFHDISSGNNSVPGQSGFATGAGYDQVTGLGSVDANVLANMWNTGTASPAKLTVVASPVTVNRGQSASVKIATSATSLNAAVAISVSGAPAGMTATLSSATVPSPGSGNVTLTLAASSGISAGVYSLTVTATSGSISSTTTIVVTVIAPTFTLSYGGANTRRSTLVRTRPIRRNR